MYLTLITILDKSMDQKIRINETDSEIQACYPVMVQLRPHLSAEQFLSQVRQQMRDGYKLASLIQGGQVVAVAGYRILRCLAWSRFLYVDDLVTDEAQRSLGHGKALLDWLIGEARREECQELHLDSGIQRKDAHRFYNREGMQMLGYHYRLEIKQ